MKRSLCLLLAALTLILCGCGKKTVYVPEEETSEQSAASLETLKQPASTLSFFKNTQTLDLTQDDISVCSVEYPVLKLSADDAEKYPALKRTLDNVNTAFIQNGQTVFEQLSAPAVDAFFADKEDFVPYGRTVSVFLPRSDSRAVSILCRSVMLSGGDHEDITYSSLNCDTVSGRELDIRSIVNDMAVFRDVLETGLADGYPDVRFTALMDGLNRYMEEPSQFVWTLDYQGITVYFNPYDLTGYDAGLLTVSLRFDNYQELLNQSYADVPSSYVSPLIDGKCYNFDLDLNGVSDEIKVDDSYSEELGYSDVLNITVNGRSVSTKTGLKAYECYVVHAGLGRDYLFIDGENLNDYGYINIFRLDKTGAGFVGGLYETSLHAAAYSGFGEGRTVLTNPDSFVMGTLCKLLYPQVGIKTYRIGNDGMPESSDSFYLLSSPQILTSKNELSTVSINPDTGSGTQAAVKIPAKTQFYFWRTDGTSYIDMKTSTGTACRLFITVKNKLQYVNGVSAEELFDGTD